MLDGKGTIWGLKEEISGIWSGERENSQQGWSPPKIQLLHVSRLDHFVGFFIKNGQKAGNLNTGEKAFPTKGVSSKNTEGEGDESVAIVQF